MAETSWPIPDLDEVDRARASIAPHMRPTPVLEPGPLARALGTRVALKCENFAPTGAFKVRGGLHLVSTMPEDERRRGVVAASTGNHAQSVAFASSRFGVRAVIVMPENTARLKVDGTRDQGAEVILTGRDFDEARATAEALAASEGYRYIHSANEPKLIAGVATATREFLDAVPDLDIIFVPLGGGSGALGAAVVARAVNPRIKVIAVQAEGAPAIYRSWVEKRRVVTERIATFAEGLATREPFELPLQWLPRMVDEIVLVSDVELADAIRMLYRTARVVVEGAGAAGLACAWKRKDMLKGQNVGIILSGGNLAIERAAQILGAPDGTPPNP